MLEWNEYLKLVTGLLAIVNPIGALPIFVSMTANETEVERKKTTRTTGISVFLVLVIAMFIGDTLLNFFGISIPSFRVSGGILILLMAIAMLQAKRTGAKQTEEEAEEAELKESVGVVPLAIPLLAGPGAISTVILYAQRDGSAEHMGIIISAIFVVAGITWGAMRLSPAITRMLGRTGINIVTRVMGLIMAAIAIEFIANGLRQLLPGLS